MTELHCSECGRFLCKLLYGEVEIKCQNNKCKHINKFVVITHKSLLRLTTEEETLIIKS